jgi:hypothetical protein
MKRMTQGGLWLIYEDSVIRRDRGLQAVRDIKR